MNPVRLAVRRPVLITMLILVFVVIGVNSYSKLSQELIPDIDFPILTIQTIYPGAGPKEVESQVSQKIEDAVSAVSNIEKLQSINREGFSFVFVRFELGTDIDVAASDVKDKVDAILIDLPDDAETPVVEKFDLGQAAIVKFALFGDRPADEMYDLASNEISDAFSQVDGVASVELIGGQEREIHVQCSKERLRAYGLSILDVVQAIAVENLDVPAGRIIDGPEEISVRLAAKYHSMEAIERTRILLPTGKSILLRDVADVRDSLKERRDASLFAERGDDASGIETQAKPAIGVEVQKTSGANTVSTADGVFKALEELYAVLPSGVELKVVEDTSKYIRDSVRDVMTNIVIGILLTSLLLFLFLHDVRATLIVATVMPVSVVATFTLMYAAGFTLNVISLMALGVAIGTLVVNAIVVLENISRFMDIESSADEAAVQGTNEVAVAVAASVLTNVVVFTPIAFMKGIIGQFFYQFGMTVVFATIFSLIVSFTLTPMMAAKFLKKTGDKRKSPFQPLWRLWDRAFGSLEESYRGTLAWSLKHRWVTVSATILVFYGAMRLFAFVGGEFFPEGDQGKFFINTKMPPGTSVARHEETLREIERIVKENVPEVEKLQIKVGGGTSSVEDGQIFVDIGEAEFRTRGIKEIVNKLRPKLAVVPAAEITALIGDGGPGYGLGDIEIEVTGPELDEVYSLAKKLEATMDTVDGLVDIRVNFQTGKPEYTFVPNREQMARYGVYTGQIAQVLRASYEGAEASRYSDRGEEYDIRVQLTDAERNDPYGLESILVPTPLGQIPITQLGDIRFTQAESEIRRLDKRRLIIVSGNIGEGDLTGMVAAIQSKIDAWDSPVAPGYKIHFGGQAEMQSREFGYIFEAMILAIVLTYMVLCAIMESYIHPFTVMLTLPLGLVGTAVALFLGGVTINLMSLMAVVMLVGIVVNNAILILDYVSQLRDKGKAMVEALIEASVTRLRPIVMTNLAIALAIAPQAMSGSGAEFRRAVAVVTMGGVLVSAIFTLFLIPAIYSAFDLATVRGYREYKEAKAAAKDAKG